MGKPTRKTAVQNKKKLKKKQSEVKKKGRKNIRKIVSNADLSKLTITANEREDARRKRLHQKEILVSVFVIFY